MTQITDHLARIETCIDRTLESCGRSGESVTLVAVSKLQPAAAVVDAANSGLLHFGENYLQEGIEKMRTVSRSGLNWHFIGQIQSNKTKLIAENFSWVDTIDRTRIADRLDAQRPQHLGPMNVLIQLNVDNEPQKGGVSPEAALPLAEHIASLPGLRLRGVLGMPPAGSDATRNRTSFLEIAAVAEELRAAGFEIDTISMGMSSDYELAIECGSNCVRIGTALFGPRDIFSGT